MSDSVDKGLKIPGLESVEESKEQYVLRRVRENLEKRKQEGAYTSDDEELISDKMVNGIVEATDSDRSSIDDMMNTWSIENKGYNITSHRKLIGPFLVKGRQIVNGEVRRYVDYSLLRQQDFNKYTLKAFESLQTRLSRIESDLTAPLEIAAMSARLSALENKFQELSKTVNDVDYATSYSDADTNSKWASIYHSAVTPEEFTKYLTYHEEFLSLISQFAERSAINRQPKLIEIGIGTATFAIYFSRQAYEVVAIDNDVNVVRIAQEANARLGGHAKFLLIDAFDLGLLKDHSFDVAYSQGTMEHFGNEDILLLLRNQLKVAKYVAFSVPSQFYPGNEFGNERKMTLEAWRNLLVSANFNIVYIGYYGNKEQIACVLLSDPQ